MLYNEFSSIFTSGIAPLTYPGYSKVSRSGAITLWAGSFVLEGAEHCGMFTASLYYLLDASSTLAPV